MQAFNTKTCAQCSDNKYQPVRTFSSTGCFHALTTFTMVYRVQQLKKVLQKYRDDRVTTYQRFRKLFANATNALRTELTTVSEKKSKESVDIVLDRVSDTQTAVTTFFEEMQGFEKELGRIEELKNSGDTLLNSNQ